MSSGAAPDHLLKLTGLVGGLEPACHLAWNFAGRLGPSVREAWTGPGLGLRWGYGAGVIT